MRAFRPRGTVTSSLVPRRIRQSAAAPRVAQRRAGPTGQNGGHPAAVLREEARTDDRVDAAVDADAAARVEPVLDRAAPKAKL